MTRHDHASHWLLLGGWLLMMPPVPLQTSLPPLSAWSRVSTHKTADECESSKEAMRKAARFTISKDAGASAIEVATALGKLQATCVQQKEPARPEPAPAPPAAAAPAPDANPAPAPDARK